MIYAGILFFYYQSKLEEGISPTPEIKDSERAWLILPTNLHLISNDGFGKLTVIRHK